MLLLESSQLHLLLLHLLLLQLSLPLLLLYLLLVVALHDVDDLDSVLGRQQLVEDCSLINVSIHECKVPSLGALTNCALQDS